MNNTIRKEFGFAGIITVVAVALAMWYGFRTGGWERALNDMLIVLVLGVMEISLSFDNAVINASVLKNMSAKWQQRFLVWGILIAVVGMRLVFPLAIVAISSGLGFFEVGNLALNSPEQYALELEKSAVTISAFGGVFLLMVALNYFIDTEKDEHWLMPESRLAGLARVEAVQVIIAMVALMGLIFTVVPVEQRLAAMSAGLVGLLIYLAVNALGGLFDVDNMAAKAGAAGFASFMYLEVLDASFSLDGVIGAFAITKEIVIISAGLAIGAVFVRSITLFLVHQGTLAQYRFLEHGAHYGILALSLIMLYSMSGAHVPEVVTGLIGVAFIVASILASLAANRREKSPG
ncbi:DUF475 domain-containing protein [Deinococcus psychrotolerans]|uniref:DUF475 domain-containing protein n=1 Tax=Deinococcus psychrotolerans TaxID=2489213 RepID=A0A3G8YE20_9DEIO|nr:DUF475 domain-containing protein [Deinococcus psychrotolerans]AZI43183.1 DUF475 domain-containing protein [Deinococcus psychrotolerans]